MDSPWRNTWNYDITTYCFGYVSHSSNKQAAVPRGLQMYREIELVGTKTKSLPHSVKLASLQGASGAAGELVFLYKVKLVGFGRISKLCGTASKKAPKPRLRLSCAARESGHHARNGGLGEDVQISCQ